MKKNEEYIVDIIDNGIDGDGIAKINTFTVFVPQTLKGERVRIIIVKVHTSYAFAKCIEIIKKSTDRVDEDCSTYRRCGGCSLRYMNYEKTLQLKTEMVKNCIKKEVNENIPVNNAIGMGNPYNYRNKLQYPVGMNKDNMPIMGVYAKRSHDIIETTDCLIQDKKAQDVAQDAFEYLMQAGVKPYNESNQSGTLRHIIIRTGLVTGEMMLTLVLNTDKLNNEREFIEKICSKHKEIKTIVKNINKRNTNVILGKENEVIYGDGYIYDQIGEYKFKISPLSFYQVNPVQTELLYNIAIEYAELTGKETVLDLYCGIGTIGIFASRKAKKLYGIEIIESAIEDAKENAKLNDVHNADFYAGDVEEILPVIMKKEKIAPDVVFVDPPRKGCDSKTIDNLLLLNPKRIVYVSCNPATLARDLKKLSIKYEIKQVQPVDMFPWTRSCGVCCGDEIETKFLSISL